jgi:hypothetical protein
VAVAAAATNAAATKAAAAGNSTTCWNFSSHPALSPGSRVFFCGVALCQRHEPNGRLEAARAKDGCREATTPVFGDPGGFLPIQLL